MDQVKREVWATMNGLHDCMPAVAAASPEKLVDVLLTYNRKLENEGMSHVMGHIISWQERMANAKSPQDLPLAEEDGPDYLVTARVVVIADDKVSTLAPGLVRSRLKRLLDQDEQVIVKELDVKPAWVD